MGASNEDRNGFSGSDRFMSITFYWRRFGGGAMVLLKVIFASNLQHAQCSAEKRTESAPIKVEKVGTHF